MKSIGFIGRTEILFDTINLLASYDQFEIAFIWTCKDEDYYKFEWDNFKSIATELNCPFILRKNDIFP
jgi:hypothetical protein